MAERPRSVNISSLLDQGIAFEIKNETQEERVSRLKREESQAEAGLALQAAEANHKLRINLWINVFAMAVVALAFLVSLYIAVAGDPKTGLPDKAMNIITAIIAGGVGYLTGKGSK